MSLGIILTARMSSERLPGKAMLPVTSREPGQLPREEPLIYWIIRRLQTISPTVILATSDQESDRPLADYVRSMGLPTYCGALDDVIGRMEEARLAYAPQADFILRGLGDCPFMDGRLIQRSVAIMRRTFAEAFRWHLAPYCWPVYGSREFPFDIYAWKRIVERSTTREHVDSYYHDHLSEFAVAYHEPPPSVHFRPYRLEVDWPEDLELIREIGSGPGMLAPVPDIIHFLDEHPPIASLNRQRVERTGMSTYDYQTQRVWMRAMEGRPVTTWNDHVWYAPKPNAQPIFCQSGQDLMGFAVSGTLHTKLGKIRGEAMLECPCGAGRSWNSAIKGGTRK